MKIRITGTKEECEAMTDKFLSLRQPGINVETSALYANRAPSKLYRLYIEISFPNESIIRHLLLK